MDTRSLNPLLSRLLLLLLLSGCGREAGPVPPAPGRPWFRDATATARLDFTHHSGPLGTFHMPQSIGSGGALLDYDNDGLLDVYLVHNTTPPHSATSQLFHQSLDGFFENVSAGSGLDVAGPGMGAAVGDVNNDALPDLLLTEFHGVRLFVNQGGGRFLDQTAAANIRNTRWAASAAFFDYDRDGWLDLVVANYVDYTPSIECKDPGGKPDFCGPQGMPGTSASLFRNLGHSAAPRFEETTVTSGLARKTGAALGVVCADFDRDRWPDILLTDDGRPNRLYINQRDGRFSEQAASAGLAYNALGSTAGNMGVTLGDVDGNGLFDLFVTHLAWEQHALWFQDRPGQFQDRTAAAGLSNPSLRGTGFGTILADFNNDGALDLAWVNGHIKRAQPAPPFLAGMDPFWNAYAQPRQLFANDGTGRFVDVSAENNSFCQPAAVGRGLACGDINNDGSPDLLVMNTSAPARLYLNAAGGAGHWVTIRTIDPAAGGRDAYGAEISVQSASKRWWRLVQPGYGYLVSNDPRAHFGLGKTNRIDRIEVIWPDGIEERFPGGEVDRFITLEKGAGSTP